MVEAIVAAFGIKAGALLAGERVQIAADAFDGLGDLFGGTLARAFEKEMLDEMGDAVKGRRFVASADADPQPKADAGHVRHLRRGDGQAAFEPGNLVHALRWPRGRLRNSKTHPHPGPLPSDGRGRTLASLVV